MAIREEQETTVTGNRKEGVYYVWTADPVHIRKFDAAVEDGRISVTKRGEDWAEFEVSAEFYDPARGLKQKRKPMSEERRAAVAERFAKARSDVKSLEN